ncbi:MAG: nitroreductase family protein [Eubacteriales bacterium]|nr:nitroreductase family protein [Eubacteriales bacterium]
MEKKMDIKEAIRARHSVRRYKDDPIPDALSAQLEDLIGECNEASGLHFQLIRDDPECFDTLLAHYGWLKNVKNYVAVVGPKDLPDLEEKGGYYGQKIVLAAQMAGLNTCWVAGTYKKGKCKADRKDGETVIAVIAIGYGEDEGKKHKSKPLSRLCSVPADEMPVWFRNGVKAAMMAPTAMNQQKFFITLEGEDAVITAGRGPMTKIDLGIVKYNFEAASGRRVK